MKLLLEHSGKPGTVYEDCLMYDGGYAVLNEMNLQETTDPAGNKLIRFRGLLQAAEEVNKNKRMYSFGILDENRARLQSIIEDGGLVGELDHPADSIVHFSNSSHKITKLWWENKKLMGEGAILDTPSGKILKALINCGVKIGMSSRGVGNGKTNEQGILVIDESYRLITFDCVADPSTKEAWQTKIAGTKEENVIYAVKNESRCIDNVSDKLVSAYISEAIKKTTREIKARLS